MKIHYNLYPVPYRVQIEAVPGTVPGTAKKLPHLSMR